MFRSSNPAMKAFQKPQTWADFQGSGAMAAARPTTMTMGGTAFATSVMVGITMVAAAVTWGLLETRVLTNHQYNAPYIPAMGGAIVGLVLALIISFKPRTAPVLGPIYAAAEGVFCGGLSLMVGAIVSQNVTKGPFANISAGGIVFQAFLLTFGVVAAMLIAYRTGLIRVTGVFAKVVIFATMAVFFTYLASMVLRMFGMGIPFIHSTGPIGIAFSGFVVVLAALNLVMDFQFIDEGVKSGQPKYMEWYAGFGLLVTIVWLYVEVLHLLYKIAMSFQQE